MINTQQKRSLEKNHNQGFMNKLGFGVSGPKRSSSSLCSRRNYMVDLTLFNHIISPSSMNIFMCNGNCPPYYLPGTSANAVFRRLSLPSSAHVPEPCCVPKTFTRTPLLIHDENESVLMHYIDNLVVNGCECR